MIKKAVFVKSITNLKDEPTPKKQLLLLGRSNVGKSSFINAICQRKSLARVSKTPGKTITLNYYELNDQFYLVDAPGYGYAKRSKKMQEDFSNMIHHYLEYGQQVEFIFLLVDFKVGPTELDLQYFEYVRQFPYELVLIVTKYDQIPKTKRIKQEKMIKSVYNHIENVFFISNETKENLNKLTDFIVERMEK